MLGRSPGQNNREVRRLGTKVFRELNEALKRPAPEVHVVGPGMNRDYRTPAGQTGRPPVFDGPLRLSAALEGKRAKRVRNSRLYRPSQRYERLPH